MAKNIIIITDEPLLDVIGSIAKIAPEVTVTQVRGVTLAASRKDVRKCALCGSVLHGGDRRTKYCSDCKSEYRRPYKNDRTAVRERECDESWRERVCDTCRNVRPRRQYASETATTCNFCVTKQLHATT